MELQHNEGAAAGSDFHLAAGLDTGQFGQHIIFTQNQFLAVEAHGTERSSDTPPGIAVP